MPNLSAWFGDVDALVCMGGYNTLAEAANAGTATVCVPRVAPRAEQAIRAQAFARLGLLQAVDRKSVPSESGLQNTDAKAHAYKSNLDA